MEIENLINWGELSRMLAGSRSAITRSRVPKKHKEAINELLEFLEKWKQKNIPR